MSRRLSAVLALVVALTGAVLGVPTAATADPAVLITVDGTGVVTYPAFDPAISRYGITTTDATAGTVTVTATTAAPTDQVWVDGRLAPDGTRTLSGLTEGDEVAVWVVGAGGTSRYSFIYLPAGFPRLVRDTALPGENPSPGMVLLTLSLFTSPSSYYETAVDPNGVPVYVHATSNSLDLKPLPTGSGYSVARLTTTAGRTGWDIVELNSSFQEVRRRHTVGLVNTDNHDSVVMPDGSIWFVAYERRSNQPGWVPGSPDWQDAVIQHVGADGQVLFQWNSKDHVDPTQDSVYPLVPLGTGQFDQDYAHINSLQVVDGGAAVLASFRHLSSVYKIAVTGPQSGDVLWKLGGRDSTFTTFLDTHGDPTSGPCGEHTAYLLANGHVLMFDNGSHISYGPRLCVDPSDPHGATIDRAPTRIAEWSLDDVSHTATLAWEYEQPERFAIFAGSAQRLTNGNTVVGWAASPVSVASEISPSGALVWDLKDPDDHVPGTAGNQPFFTYRAFKADVPDTQRPVVTVQSPAAGATYLMGATAAPPVADCTDRGGSSLQTCTVPTTLPTNVPGTHTYQVTATDGAGNTTTVTRSYRVLGPGRPDATARTGGSPYVGQGRRDGSSARNRVTLTLPRSGSTRSATVRITNAGDQPAQFVLDRSASTSRFRVALSPTGARRSPVLAPGKSWTVRVAVVRAHRARPGDERDFVFRVRSTTDATLRDSIVVRARATR